jgi:hypothetical protein
MVLKNYTLAGHNLAKLHKEVAATSCVTAFEGIVGNSNAFSILGGVLADEAALDALVATHDPTVIPEEITPRQARQILFLNGFTDAQIVALFNQMASPQKELALIEWGYSTAFVRANPLINQMGAALGLTSTQVDQMFIAGAQL